MNDALLAGAPCDVLHRHRRRWSSRCSASGELRGATRRAIGAVQHRRSRCAPATPRRAIDDADALKAALLAAPALYFPDATRRPPACTSPRCCERLGIARRARAAAAHVRQRRDRDARARRSGRRRRDRLHAGDRDPLHAGADAGRRAAGAVRSRHGLSARRSATTRATTTAARRFIDAASSSAALRVAGGCDGRRPARIRTRRSRERVNGPS